MTMANVIIAIFMFFWGNLAVLPAGWAELHLQEEAIHFSILQV